MTDLSNKVALVYDLGLFTGVAERLARDCAKVYYYVPWEDAFPKMSKALIGEGLDNVERIRNFEDYVDMADFIVFPDTHCGSKVEFLRRQGYYVAGVGRYEELELNRWKMRVMQNDSGMPTQDTVLVTGLSSLKDYLSEYKDKFVKLNIFRGDVETFYHSDYESSLPLLNHLAYDLGPKGDTAEFIVEDCVKGAEPGLDAIVYNGKVVSPTMYGYEVKGAGYIGKVVPYDSIPKQLKMVSDAMMPMMSRYRFFFSTEVMIPNKTEGFLIDPCCRFAAPAVAAIETELITNFSHVLYHLAVGETPVPTYQSRYCAGIVVYSSWASTNWLNVSIPDKLKKWVKLRMFTRFPNDTGKMENWSVPGHETIGTVIAFGDSPDEASNLAIERAKEVKGYQLDGGEDAMIKVKKAIEKGKEYGITF